MLKKEPVVGIFDSGVGGFSVVKEIRKSSDATIVYYGDCARAPYGNKSQEEIAEYIKDDITFLQDKGVTHFINACNSMSVLATDALLKKCKVDISMYTDMIRAFDAHAIFSKEDKVLVLATCATIRSGMYQEVLTRKGVSVFEYAFSQLAFAIENNATREELLAIIKKGMMYAQEVRATHIVYACTHYPLVHGLFVIAQEEVGWKGEYINPAVYVSKEMRKWKLEGERKFYPYSSKDTAVFIKNVIQFL